MNENKLDCPCKRKCERHGSCDSCKEHHHSFERKLLVACERLKAKEVRKKTKK